jgi:hypothetical protein
MRGGGIFNYSIVTGHAPAEISDGERKKGFFDSLERAYDISQRNYIKVVAGDFNAQMGEKALIFSTVGRCNLYNLTNHNAFQLIQFAVSQFINIGLTIYPH